jgi:hypothetical protein
MNPKTDRNRPEQPRPAEEPKTEKKRFRIEKIEERIAPKKGHGGSGNDFSSYGSASIF